jgi:hypothetical protein
VKQQFNKTDQNIDKLFGVSLLNEANVQREVGRQIATYVSNDHFVVPVDVTELRIFAMGASGGSGNGFGVLLNNGGEGGTAVSNIKVSPGETLEIFVGVRGEDGSLPNGGHGGGSTSGFVGGTAAPGKAGGGGGGGGASGAIRVRGEEVLVVAGGGGGGSGVGNGGLIGRGGAGGSFGTSGRGLVQGKVRHGCGTRGGSGPIDSNFGSGGGGGGLYGGGAGSSLDLKSSGGGAGGTGTLERGLSSDGGGQANSIVLVSFDRSSDSSRFLSQLQAL